MTHGVMFEPSASHELNKAADFYDLERPGLGTEFLDAVEDALLAVADNPGAVPTELGETRKRVQPASHVVGCRGRRARPGR